MLKRIAGQIAVTFALCVVERMFERILFPGLHHLAGRAATNDPTRLDSLTILISEAIALFLLVWLFNGSLYAIAWLRHQHLRPFVPVAISLVILTLIFAGSFGTWYSTPTLPPLAGVNQ